MHRTIAIATPAQATDELVAELRETDYVVGLSVQRGASVKPAGDVVVVHALNRGADHVLRLVEQASAHGETSVVTGELGTMVSPGQADAIRRDTDEAIWEEAETALRHQGGVTLNFMVLMAAGGVVAAGGLLTPSAPAQTIALVAASVIAPGFEVLAKIPLGLVLGRSSVVAAALWAALAGYGLVVASACATFLLLDSVGSASADDFASNAMVKHLASPTGADALIASAAAIAGTTMLTAYRSSVIAGPLIALAVVPAAAMTGVALVAERLDLALAGLERLGLDLVVIFAWGALVVLLKQLLVHRRRPLS